jgi:hypothetical protein
VKLRATAIAVVAIIAVIGVIGVSLGAGCSSRDEPSQRSAEQAEGCAPCTDPETEAGSYVSIGVMPSPYPISWASPYDMFVTTIGTSAASAGLIGHGARSAGDSVWSQL